MTFKELPLLAKRRLTNQLRGFALRYGFTNARKFDVKFLFTTMQGIFLYDSGKIRKIVKNQHFGITTLSNNAFISTEWLSKSPIEKSAVYVYQFDGRKVTDKREIIFKDAQGEKLQPYGVHQLRVLNGYLWVVNTRENVVWQCSLDGIVLHEWTESHKLLFDKNDPQKTISLRKATSQYAHYNSIAYNEGYYYILAHNCTQDSEDLSQRSYIVKLDDDLRIVDRIENVGRASHDLVFVDKYLYVCSSREGVLLRNNEPTVKLDAFLRGTSHHNKLMVIGGSQFEVKSSARESTPSKLFFLDLHDHTLLTTVTLGRVGNIRDLLFWMDPH